MDPRCFFFLIIYRKFPVFAETTTTMRASVQCVRQLINFNPIPVRRRTTIATYSSTRIIAEQEFTPNNSNMRRVTTENRATCSKKKHNQFSKQKIKYFSTQRTIQDHADDALFDVETSLLYARHISLILSLPIQYLREIDPSNYNTATGQRIDVNKQNYTAINETFDKNTPTTQLSIQNCSYNSTSNVYKIRWNDGRESVYPYQLIKESIITLKGSSHIIEIKNDQSSIVQRTQRKYWSNLIESTVRSSLSIPFKDLVHDDNNQKYALQLLYEYGILLVSNTPVDDTYAPGAVAVLASVFGGSSNKQNNTSSLLYHYRQGNRTQVTLPYGTDGPLQTLYSTVWSTTIESTVQGNGSSYADSAYTNDALPLHTDLTYHLSPPGLQLFTMQLPSANGGESIFCDGFAIAEQLKQQNLEAFHTLSTIKRTYRSIDLSTGWNLQASGPIISLSNGQHTIQSIRHNDLDRLPDLPPSSMTDTHEIDTFYSRLQAAHVDWNTLLNDNTYRLELSLKKGDTIIVANQVCTTLSCRCYCTCF
jgi:alpha-ketoglutarate-dependent taurine dioxygenase